MMPELRDAINGEARLEGRSGASRAGGPYGSLNRAFTIFNNYKLHFLIGGKGKEEIIVPC